MTARLTVVAHPGLAPVYLLDRDIDRLPDLARQLGPPRARHRRHDPRCAAPPRHSGRPDAVDCV